MLTEKVDGSDMFAIKQALSPSSVMSNMGAVHAGEATLELAAQLVGEELGRVREARVRATELRADSDAAVSPRR